MTKSRIILLLGLAMLAWAIIRSGDNAKLTRFQHLRGWQKIFGLLAVILTLLMILNPEFIALGLFGDAAFFDLVVLALSLRMHGLAAGAWHRGIDWLSRGARRLGIPSPGLVRLLAVLTLAIGAVASALQKAVNRILS